MSLTDEEECDLYEWATGPGLWSWNVVTMDYIGRLTFVCLKDRATALNRLETARRYIAGMEASPATSELLALLSEPQAVEAG
jgi:hypothetical protein